MNRMASTQSIPRKAVGRMWLLAALFACSLLYVLFQGGKLSLMVFLMICVLGAYLLMGRWSGIAGVRGTRELLNAEEGASLEADTQLEVRVRVQIPGIWPIPYVVMRDTLVRKGDERITTEGVFIPDWYRRGEIVYTTPPLKRGYYAFQKSQCSTEDIFGLFEHTGELQLESYFSVYPKTVAIREWKAYRQLSRGLHYHSASTRAQRETTQINGVRDYVYGDKISRIHWNATARTGHWKSKEFERESLPKTVFVLDRNGKSYAKPEQFELAVSAAASMIKYCSNKEMSIGLLSHGKQLRTFEARQGAGHIRSMLNHLIEAEPDGAFALPAIVETDYKTNRRHSFYVMITPKRGDELHRALRFLGENQMVGCIVWLASGASADEREEWVQAIHAQGHIGYAITNLNQLPEALGGTYA